MDALKKFLQKKKADSTFKKAGPGHKLADSAGAAQASSGGRSTGGSSSAGGPKKAPVSSQSHAEERRQAALAALSRQEKAKPTTTSEALIANRQLAYIKEQARKEIEAEKKLKEIELDGRKSDGPEKSESAGEVYTMQGNVDSSQYAVSGVFFTCPIIGPEVLTKPEIEESIRRFLHAQPKEELSITSCLLIHSCNKSREKIQVGVNTLCKYIDNIIQDPNEPKFKKIRCNNKAYLEKVAVLEGTNEFLEAAGFKKVKQSTEDSQEEEVWEFSPLDDETSFIPRLTELRDTLNSATPIKPELDRNLQVLMPAQIKQRRELPPEFYELTGEELRREQQKRTETVELERTLRTKAQRERDELREQRLYRYVVMRIRFPDGFTLQGTFRSMEKVGDLYAFVQENLGIEDAEFSLRKAGGEVLDNLDQSLAEAKLPPASIVNFVLQSSMTSESNFLKPEILALVQDPTM